MSEHDKEIARLKRRITGLERTLQIVSGHSARTEINQKQLLKAVSEIMPVPMVIASEGGDILFCNNKAREILGYNEEELQRLRAADLYENAGARREFLARVTERGEVRDFIVNLKKSNGVIFPVSFFSQRLVFEGQDCHVTVFHDLSEIRKEEQKRLAMEAQLRQAQKMEAIGTMAGGIAHDFNNVLTVIFGKAELALLLLPAQGRVRTYIGDVLTAANRAREMIRQLMAFSRKGEEQHKPFSIKFIVAEAARMIEAITPSNIRLKVTIDAASSAIVGDPTQIHQILMNLCSNANYAMRDPGGVIEIRLEEVSLAAADIQLMPRLAPGRYVRLTVRDNGPGIDREVIDRIFEPFFTTKPTGEGTGMGLAVVHGIVQRHGGGIAVESSPGTGTAFHCYFPLVDQLQSRSADLGVPREIEGGREKVLLVDDDAKILETYGQVLADLGYRVTAEVESSRALQLVLEDPHRFDLVITDEKMPKMSGRRLIGEIRKCRADLPVLVITGSEMDEQSFIRIGAAAVVVKPFSRHEFAAAIRTVIDRGRGGRPADSVKATVTGKPAAAPSPGKTG